MTNEEVFREYGSEQWLIEQNLHFLLQKFVDKCGHRMSEVPFNTVGFIKDFMKEETICETCFAEKSKIETLENSIIIDGEFTEIIGENDNENL